MDEEKKEALSPAGAPPEDEISLVDLLVVCVKYRKLIIGLPLVAALAVFLYLYALPIFGLGVSGPDYNLQLVAKISSLPANVQGRLDFDVAKNLGESVSSIPVVQAAYSKYFPPAQAPATEELASVIKKEVIGKSLGSAYDAATQRFTLSFRTKDRKNGELFLAELWSVAEGQARSGLQDHFRDAIATVVTQLGVYDSGSKLDVASLAGKAELTSVLASLRQYQQDSSYPFDGAPTKLASAEPGPSRSKPVVLTFFGALFCALLLAFVLNAGKRMREDPEAMAKLRAAWKG